MKKIKLVLCAFFTFSVLLPSVKTEAAMSDFGYQYVDQSPNPTLNPGDSAILWIKLKNTGNVAWTQKSVRLGTSGPRDRNSVFMPSTTNAPELANKKTNWIAENRIVMEKEKAEVGETVGFGFYIKVPANQPAGVYKEYFRPVVDGVDWMKDIGIYWEIKVGGSNPAITAPTKQETVIGEIYDYEIVNQSAIPGTLKQGGEADVWIDLKNTGTATWKNNGPNPVRLGAGSKYSQSPVDAPSDFFAPTYWMAMNRSATFQGSEVKPGETARFSFKLKVPEFFNSGDYKAYFTPVVEGIKWMKDVGIYWPIKVLRDTPPEVIVPNAFVYELNSQIPSSPISMIPGETKEVSIKIKNTGSASWFKEGEDKVVLGWGSKYDTINQIKGFASGVEANLLQNEVKPGEIGEFKFQIKAPNTAGMYKFYFTPLVQGISPQPFKDIGIHWVINVNSSNRSPMTPSNLKVEKCADQPSVFCIVWSSEVRDGVASTDEIYRSTSPNTGFNLIATVNTGGYRDANISQGVTYYYKVRSKFANSGYSDYSSVVSGQLTSTTVGSPTSLKVEQCLSRMFCISWTTSVKYISSGVVYATDELYRSTNSNSGFSLIYSGSSGSYQDSNVVEGTTYYYKVRRTYNDGNGYSNYSNVVSGYIKTPEEKSAEVVMTTPVLSISNITANSITLNWQSSNGNNEELYFDTNPNGSFSQMIFNGLNSYTHSGLLPGTKYYYKIRGVVNSGGVLRYGPYSSVVSAITNSISGTGTIKVYSNKAMNSNYIITGPASFSGKIQYNNSVDTVTTKAPAGEYTITCPLIFGYFVLAREDSYFYSTVIPESDDQTEKSNLINGGSLNFRCMYYEKNIKGDFNGDTIIDDSDLTTMYSMYNGSMIATDKSDLDGDGQKAKIGDLKEMVRIYKSQPEYKQGDINKDGTVNQSDLNILSQMIAGQYSMTIINIVRGDMDGDLSISTNDKLILQSIVVN
uniref:Dockerin domain-containing protein n=1 Tax=candidate division CPR3 bacterium TaxID=2268181 RepID=A0A7C4M0G6_UNCC3